MKLLVNDKEIARFLISLIDVYERCKDIKVPENETAGAIAYILEKKQNPKFTVNKKFNKKMKDKIRTGVSRDMLNFIRTIENKIKEHNDFYFTNIHKYIEYFFAKLGEEKVFEMYRRHPKQYFIKTVGYQLSRKAVMMRRKNFSSENILEDCLLRNTVGNEKIIVDKIDNNLPFWFIDSGYTNFLETNKKWHRLVRNHLHFNQYFDAPTDRLSNFTSFPAKWKPEGRKILIVEPGPFAAAISHTDPVTWRNSVIEEIRKYTDRPIEVREKINKKKRTSLYKQLLTGDYYCTVSINSNSAVESIWAGVPAITLDKHISNPVTVNSIDQINNLYRGPLGNWLAWLSYCQFTFEELMDGTAVEIIKKYHGTV